jgi:hypothetical protein
VSLPEDSKNLKIFLISSNTFVVAGDFMDTDTISMGLMLSFLLLLALKGKVLLFLYSLTLFGSVNLRSHTSII